MKTHLLTYTRQLWRYGGVQRRIPTGPRRRSNSAIRHVERQREKREKQDIKREGVTKGRRRHLRLSQHSVNLVANFLAESLRTVGSTASAKSASLARVADCAKAKPGLPAGLWPAKQGHAHCQADK